MGCMISRKMAARPLRAEVVEWVSPAPVTRQTIQTHRLEVPFVCVSPTIHPALSALLKHCGHHCGQFWTTAAAALGGGPDVWQALREASETNNLALARVILDSVGLRLPWGRLSSCYDALGRHYSVPNFCLSYPTNVADDAVPSVAPVSFQQQQEEQEQWSLTRQTVGSYSGMLVRLRLSTGEHLNIRLLPSDTVQQLMQEVEAYTCISMTRFLVYFKGIKLLPQQLLRETGFNPDSDVLQVFLFFSSSVEPDIVSSLSTTIA